MNDKRLIGRPFGNYRPLAELGETGEATIYLALDGPQHRYVRLAVLRANTARGADTDPAVPTSARLEHANIARLEGAGRHNGQRYLVWEHTVGIDLALLLARYHQAGERMPPGDAIHLLAQIGQALDAAHAAGIVHGHVNAEQIVVTPNGQAVLAGLGLGEATGTTATVQTDLAQFVALAHQLLTGEPLPVGGGQKPMAALPPALAAILRQALSADGAQHFSSQASLAAALGTAINSTREPVQVPSQPAPPTIAPLARPAGRSRILTARPLLLLLGCSVMLLLAVIAGAAGLRLLRARTNGESSVLLPVVMPGSETTVSVTAAATEDSGEDSTIFTDEENLQIITFKGDSLFVINGGTRNLPLAGLQLGNDKYTLDGAAWGSESLAPGSCVSVWKDRGRPAAPDVSCLEVGQRLTLSPREVFWEESFSVIYDQEVIGTCSTDSCTIQLPVP